jgi:hypothetical protein
MGNLFEQRIASIKSIRCNSIRSLTQLTYLTHYQEDFYYIKAANQEHEWKWLIEYRTRLSLQILPV